MKIPLEYSKVPIAPSHSTGDVFKWTSRSEAIVFENTRSEVGFPSTQSPPARPDAENCSAIIPFSHLNLHPACSSGSPRFENFVYSFCAFAGLFRSVMWIQRAP